jgi:hypothetical protein
VPKTRSNISGRPDPEHGSTVWPPMRGENSADRQTRGRLACVRITIGVRVVEEQLRRWASTQLQVEDTGRAPLHLLLLRYFHRREHLASPLRLLLAPMPPTTIDRSLLPHHHASSIPSSCTTLALLPRRLLSTRCPPC